nr:hypothetical protein [Tanacetum cinerariifolium]
MVVVNHVMAIIVTRYENHLCNLCGNNSHDGYDCQQQFPFVHEQELSNNQNYNGNYYPHKSPCFPCCDNYGGSHENFQCQPIAQNIDFFGSTQIQTPHYPVINLPSPQISYEVFQANHSIQNEESFENPSNEIAVSKLNQEKEEPAQESGIHQLIEECSTEVSEKQKMEDMMLELVKICKEKEFLCIHDNVDDLIERALHSKLLLINLNSQRLDKKEQKVKNVAEQPAECGNRSIQSLKNFRVVHKSSIYFDSSQISSIHAIAPILSTKEPEHLLSMWYKHLIITPEMESNEVIESNAENLLPIPSKCEVTLEDKKECDLPIFENSPVCDNHSDIFADSKIDDDILVYDDDFKDIEYVKASLSDPEIVNQEEENKETFIDDSILSHESSDFNFEDNPLIPRPPPKSPDAETDAGEEIQVVMNDKDEDVYSSFILVIFAKVFALISAESEDTIFDPGISD